jgi:signal transduction histidine kinase
MTAPRPPGAAPPRGFARLRGIAGRRPVRLRLTLIYSGLFLLAGAVLLAFAYGLVASVLPSKGKTAPSESLSLVKNPILRHACASGQATPDQLLKCKAIMNSYRSGVTAGATGQRDAVLGHLLSFSILALAVMAVMSAVLGWIIAGRALRPVHAITAAARRASQENLGDRIALAGPPDELRELADTFDGMLARLDAAFASQKRFVANASHELRTPLTIMRTAIDVTLAKPGRTAAQLEDMAVEVRQAVEQAERLIEALLTLARSDRGITARDTFDLAVLAEDALDAAGPAVRAGSLRTETILQPGPAMGDPVLAGRLVSNLIGNAVRHNVTDGWIQVATGVRDGMAFIEVANGGAVIPPALIPSLFEPFHRLEDPARTPGGTGLGLSIVQSVAAAHRGQVRAVSRPAGGLEISVLLPPAGSQETHAAAALPATGPEPGDRTAGFSPQKPAGLASIALGTRLTQGTPET